MSGAGHPPSVLAAMGVSGSGKMTVAALLAGRLKRTIEDGDDLHPAANVDKMHAGIPLNDQDRWPWLRAVAAWIDERQALGGHGVVACSALRRAYRDVPRSGRPDVGLVHLKGDRGLISRRQAARDGHFMPTGLMRSRSATLEEPKADEGAVVVSVEGRPQDIAEAALGTIDAVLPTGRGSRDGALERRG